MNRKKRTIAWAAIGLAALVMASSARAQGKGITIAVVDLGEVFDKYYMKKDFDATLRAESAKRVEILQEKGKEINKLQEERQLFDLGTAARKRTEERLFQKRVELEVYKKMAQQEFLKSQTQCTVTLFEAIRSRVAQYAKKNSIDLVLKAEDRDTSGKSIEQIQVEINLRQVLYATPTLDITQKIIASLNAGHEPEPEK